MWIEINGQEVDKTSIMQMLELGETIEQLSKANAVCWYVHVLRKDKNNFLRRTLGLSVKWPRKG